MTLSTASSIGTPAPELLVYPDLAALSQAAGKRIVELANGAIASRGRFTIALSGGNTPRATYAQLAADPLRSQVNWRRVFFFWGDERAVPPDDPESNFRMAEETLLSMVPVEKDHIFRIAGELDPKVAATEYERVMRQFFGTALPRFDLVLLGLGSNGHTASLFPDSPALADSTRLCVAVWVPELKANRITLTAPVLNNAANVIFLVAGQDKAATLRAVLKGPYKPEELPAQLIRPVDGKLLWLVDQAAASLLN